MDAIELGANLASGLLGRIYKLHNKGLHCFSDGNDIVVAASLKEAKLDWERETGNFDLDDDEYEEMFDIHQIPDNKIISVFVDDELKNKPDNVVIKDNVWKASAKAWAQSQGKGYLCGVE